MGLLRGNMRLLLEEHRRRPLTGSLLELGRTSVFFTRGELEGWMRLHGVQPHAAPDELSHDARLAAQGCMGDHPLFGMLGLDEVLSVDISDYEGCDLLLDLNGELPSELHGRFDVAFDCGTVHHVFSPAKVLRNMHQAVKPGGRLILATVASSNNVDHGFFMFSPTYFVDYFRANRYEINAAYLCRARYYWVDGRLYSTRWRISPYVDGCLDALSFGGFDDSQVFLFFVATRREESTCDVAPVQSYFARYLAAQPPPAPPSARGPRRRGFLYHLAKLLYTRLRYLRARRRLPVVARY
jgi:SAM-dependent methyltransferase